MSTYTEILDYLYTKRAGAFKLGLDHMKAFIKCIGHPEMDLKVIHIAGTNGKGSTAAVLASVLQSCGYKTGLYTSPHLINLRERIQINGRMISESYIIHYIQSWQIAIEETHASFFEILTAMALQYFKDQQVDVAILETGLGGRLDATNIVHPELTIITDIGFDHTKTLGKNLNAIAGEKAGICKSNIPCVTGIKRKSVLSFLENHSKKINYPLHAVIHEIKINRIRCSEQETLFSIRTPHHNLNDLRLNLLGQHQLKNVSTALLGLDILNQKRWNISENGIRSGLMRVNWPARMQLLPGSHRILVDSAHNPMGIRILVSALKNIFTCKKLIFIFGVLADKDYSAMLQKLSPLVHTFIFTKPDNERALEPDELQKLAKPFNIKSEVHPDIENAFDRALELTDKDDLICAAGSIYFVGDFIKIYQKKVTPEFKLFEE